MSLFLGGLSALEYLSLRDEGARALGSQARRYELRFRATIPGSAEFEDAMCNEASGLTPPVNLLVGSQNSRRKFCEALCHVWEGPLPDHAFWQVSRARDLYVSTPEFAFLQMGVGCTLMDLIMRGFEACGTFWPTERDVRGFLTRSPLTTPDAIRRMLCRMRPVRGSRKVERALRFVIGGAASPMEAALTMLLCLPCSMGGYGLPHPRLNREVRVPQRYRDRISQRHFSCDLYWEAARLAVEYDSSMFHAGPQDLVRDSIRRDALALLGISVITVTSGQIHNVDELDKVARLVARRLGNRIRTDRVSDWEWRRGELRKQVLFSGE